MNKDINSHRAHANPSGRKANADKKKAIIAVAVILMLLGAVSYIVIAMLDNSNEPKSPYLDNVFSQSEFTLVDDDEVDIFQNKEYLEYDRSLYMSESGAEMAVLSPHDAENDKGALFFLDYFDSLEKGDTERYNDMFTENYYTKYIPQGEFTQQMIYDIHCELISNPDSVSGASLSYIVSYKIFKNNGTFRRDITSDASRPILMTLKEVNGKLKIDNISYVNRAN